MMIKSNRINTVSHGPEHAFAVLMLEMTDYELIAESKRGDRLAASELFERYYQSSLSVARRMLHSEAECQDAVQAAYFSAFKNLEHFRGDAKFNTWLTRIVVNRCLMTMREPSRRLAVAPPPHLEPQFALDHYAAVGPSPEKMAWSKEIAIAHQDAFSKLPDGLRSAYAKYFLSGMSLEEVANSLGLSRAATKSRVFRSRRLMQSMLGSVWQDRLTRPKSRTHAPLKYCTAEA